MAKRRLKSVGALVVCSVLAIASAAVGYVVFLQIGVDDLGRRGERMLQLISSTLKDRFERAAALPGALIQFRELAHIDSRKDLTRLNLLLARVARESGVPDIFVMDYLGVVVADSNWGSSRSVAGRVFGFQPFYSKALLFDRGAYHAFREAEKDRGFYFSRAFRSAATGTRYILVARIGAQQIEKAWAEPIFALVDPNGVIFLSSQPRLLFKSFKPLTAQKQEELAQNRQFERIRIRALPKARIREIGGRRVLRLSGAGWRNGGVPYREAVVVERPFKSSSVDLGEFRAFVFLNAARARNAALYPSLAVGFGVFIILIGVCYLIGRRRAAVAQLRAEEAALADSNERLEREAEERRAAAAALKKAERELAQAQKLAALGRLSANVSHEVNQPLAAIRAYAENAEAFLGRGRLDAAASNLDRIRAMSDRISTIIANLRVFARGGSPPPRPVKLADALTDALKLVDRRLEQTGSILEREGDAWNAVAMFGRVRLAQVFVNLLNNALDAMETEEAATRRISVTAEEDGEQLIVRVRDSGAGLAPEIAQTLFDPFVTTKSLDAGPGLGLGLSIVYGLVTATGGSLSARTHPQGGAEFILKLRTAQSERGRSAALVQSETAT